MNRGIQRGVGLATLRGVNPTVALPRWMPTLPNDNGSIKWRPPLGLSAGNVILVQNTLYAYRYFIEPGNTLVGLGVVCTGVASTTVRLGVYDSDGDGPGTLLLDTQEEISSAATGFKSSAISLAEDGWVWLAVAIHGGAGQAFCPPNGGDMSGLGNSLPASVTGIGGVSQAGVTGALPNPWGVTVTEALRVPIIFVDSRPF